MCSEAQDSITCSEAQESTSSCFKTCPIHDTARYHKRINQYDADLVNEWGSMPPSCQARAWQHIKSTRCRFLAVVLKGNTKRHGLCLQNQILGNVQPPRILWHTDQWLVSATKQQWWLYAVESPNCMSWMEQRDRWGCNNPPMAQCPCRPHLWVCLRGNWTICQKASRKYHKRHHMEQDCKACSCKAGYVTSSMSGQSSGAEHCIVKQCIRAVYPAWSTDWSGSSVKTSRWCPGRWWASKTSSWLEQTSRWRGYHRWLTNLLVHPPTTNNRKWVLLLAGECIRYSIPYFSVYVKHVYISFIFSIYFI